MNLTIEYNGETFTYSSQNGYGDDCYYPDNGRKDYFVRSAREDEPSIDNPSEKNFVVDGRRYKITFAMH